MKERVNQFFNSLKSSFHADALGTILLAASYAIVFVTLLTLPTFTYASGLNNYSVILSIACAGIIGLYVLLRGEFAFNSFLLSMILLVIYDILLTFISSKDWQYVTTTLNLYMLCFFLFQFGVNSKKPVYLVSCIALGIIFFGFFYLAYYWKDIITFNFSRLGDRFGNVNGVGNSFALGVLILSSMMPRLKFKQLIVDVLMTLLLFFLLLTTGSKAALILSFLSFAVGMYLFFARRKKKILFVILLVSSVVFVFLILQLPAFKTIKNRLDDMITSLLTSSGQFDSSSYQRWTMFQDGIFLWSKNLFFGYGSGGFKMLTNYGAYSHNNYSEMLCDFGVIGFILFYGPSVLCFIGAIFNKKNRLRDLIILMFPIVFIISSCFDVIYFSKVIMIIWFACAAETFCCNGLFESQVRIRLFRDKKFLSFNYRKKSKSVLLMNKRDYLFEGFYL